MALRQLALNLQQDISTGGADFESFKEKLQGLDSSELQELCSFRVDGRTLVASVAATSKWDLLDYLINQGVKVHEVDETILHFAVVQNAESIVKSLINSGIDVNHARDDGKTPLHVASEFGHTDIVKYLLENGAEKSIDVTERSGCTPLTLAAMTGQMSVMSELIRHGANINVSSGFPALHAAALLGHTKIVNLLLENNANVNLTDAAKALAIHYAAMKNHLYVVQELIKRGSNLKAKDSRGNLPLNLAKSIDIKQAIRRAMGLDVVEERESPNSSINVSASTSASNFPSPIRKELFTTAQNQPAMNSEPETGEIQHRFSLQSKNSQEDSAKSATPAEPAVEENCISEPEVDSKPDEKASPVSFEEENVEQKKQEHQNETDEMVEGTKFEDHETNSTGEVEVEPAHSQRDSSEKPKDIHDENEIIEIDIQSDKLETNDENEMKENDMQFDKLETNDAKDKETNLETPQEEQESKGEKKQKKSKKSKEKKQKNNNNLNQDEGSPNKSKAKKKNNSTCVIV